MYQPNVDASRTVNQNFQPRPQQSSNQTRQPTQRAQGNAMLFGSSAAPNTQAPKTQGEKDLNALTQALIINMDTPKEANFAGLFHIYLFIPLL